MPRSLDPYQPYDCVERRTNIVHTQRLTAASRLILARMADLDGVLPLVQSAVTSRALTGSGVPMQNPLGGAIALALALIPTTAVMAAEVCVVCSEPAASYRCAFEGDTGAAVQPGAQLLCLKELATSARHKSCTIDRVRTAPCVGDLVTIAKPDGAGMTPQATSAPTAIDAPTAPCEETAAPCQTATPAVTPPKDASPPQTMEELAKQAADQTKKDWEQAKSKIADGTKAAGREIEDAGAAVGGVAKQSLDCVASLFTKC